MSTEAKTDSKSEIQFNERTLEAFEKENLDYHMELLPIRKGMTNSSLSLRKKKGHFKLLLKQ